MNIFIMKTINGMKLNNKATLPAVEKSIHKSTIGPLTNYIFKQRSYKWELAVKLRTER